jgi:hypothetical protein
MEVRSICGSFTGRCCKSVAIPQNAKRSPKPRSFLIQISSAIASQHLNRINYIHTYIIFLFPLSTNEFNFAQLLMVMNLGLVQQQAQAPYSDAEHYAND